MQDQDIISEDERNEEYPPAKQPEGAARRGATETPAFLGCPQHMPTHLPSGFDGVEPEEDAKAKKQKEYFRKHFSFCDGVFPIRFTNTEDGQMASCWINGRHFTLDLDNNERDDGGHDCAAVIRDNGKVVITIETQRGKSISGKVAYAAFKEYIRNLSGNRKYSSRGGFLKQQIARAAKKEVA